MPRYEVEADVDLIAQGDLEALHQLLNHPIPLTLPSREGWKEKAIVEPEDPERMVGLGPFSAYADIYTSSMYFGEHSNSPYEEGTFPNSMISLQVRESFADQIRIAQSYLPEDMFMVVVDAYRPIELQKQLYERYYGDLKAIYPAWSEEALSDETQKYVSHPMNTSIDPETKYVSPHNTGGAVDVALFRLPKNIAREVRAIDKELVGDFAGQNYGLQMRKIQLIHENAIMLNFGTDVDQSGEASALNHYEVLERSRALTGQEKEAQKNRRILYNSFRLAGGDGFEDEWWHMHSEKSQMGAQQQGRPFAEFGEATLYVDHSHERLRRTYRGSIRGRRKIGKNTHLLPNAMRITPER